MSASPSTRAPPPTARPLCGAGMDTFLGLVHAFGSSNRSVGGILPSQLTSDYQRSLEVLGVKRFRRTQLRYLGRTLHCASGMILRDGTGSGASFSLPLTLIKEGSITILDLGSVGRREARRLGKGQAATHLCGHFSVNEAPIQSR
jgi:hypothetical protein